MRRRLAALAILALAAPGCASSDGELERALQKERTETMTIITRAELNEQPAGSPARTVLELWRAVQFRDAEGALLLVDPPPARKQLRTFEDFVVSIGAQTADTTKPVILRSREDGDRATVLVDFVRRRKIGDEVRTREVGRLEAELVRSDGRWLVLWRRAADQIPKIIG